MNKELKEQAHKEFDERYTEDKQTPGIIINDMKSFIDSLIDKTYKQGYSDCWNQFKDMDVYQLGVQMTEERIVGVIEGLKIHRKPTHGSCCTCQNCGFYYGECKCSKNTKIDKIINLIKSK